MFLKIIKNLIGLNGLVFILLVFSIYFKIIELDALSPSTIHCAIAMKKAIDEVRKCTIFWQVNNALNIYNRSSIASVHDLSINLPTLVYWERKAGQPGERKALYNLLSIQIELVINELPHGPIKFKRTLIKPYFIDNISINNQQPIPNNSISTPTQVPYLKISLAEISHSDVAPVEIPPRKAFLIEELSALSTPLTSLAFVKQSCKQARKHPK